MIELAGVSKRFGEVTAVDAVDLAVAPGEFVTLVGPSGCGKTTLLRLMAGFETPDSGSIRIGGQDVVGLPPHRRNLNQVFQNYALFPHLTVRENIAFGLRMQRLAKAEIRARTDEAIALVELDGLDKRRPHQLSGGQRQRVALARAIAPRPALLLLDEPLSALDAKLRQQVQTELKALQRRTGISFVFVTHDRNEALALGDRIAVMNGGRFEQVGTPDSVYRQPASPFVADFISEANMMAAQAVGAGAGGGVRVRLACGTEMDLPAGRWPDGCRSAIVSFRPESVMVFKSGPVLRGGFGARVMDITFHGAGERLLLDLGGDLRAVALVYGRAMSDIAVREDDLVWCRFEAADLTVLPPDPTMPPP